MNITIVNAGDTAFKSLGELTKNKPSYILDKDMIENLPSVSEGIVRIGEEMPVIPANNRDTLELAKNSEDGLNADTDEIMDYESSLDFKISAGMSREQLATHFGDLGKKLDEAYARGEYTEDEYNDLNSQLLESYDNAITRCERRAASTEVDKAEALKKQADMVEVTVRKRKSWTNIEKILDGMGVEIKGSFENSREKVMLDTGKLRDIINELSESLKNGPDEDYTGEKMTPEEQHEADIKAFISRRNRLTDEFAAAYCAADRGAMLSMMNTVRQGGELVGGRDNFLGEMQAQTWFNEGYTPLPDIADMFNMQ